MKSRSKRLYMGVIAVIVWIGLVLQLYLMMVNNPDKAVLLKLINFLSYFTILTNLLVAVGLASSLLIPSSSLGKFFSDPFTESALTVYIIIVGIIHHLFLRNIADLHGWNLFADTILHKIVPLLYTLYWIFFVIKGQLHWKDGFTWLVYPFVYFVYVLVRGFIDYFYPYPFADVTKLGYGRALMNGIWIMLSFYILGLLLIAADKYMGRKTLQNA